MAVADDDDVVFHFAGEHAASFLRIVALQGLKKKDGDDDSEEDTLAPKGIELPERTRVDAEINGAQDGLGER
jgi:hypothetical protein